MHKDVVVLGGGPAGLSAAWELSQAGKSVLVLEKDPIVGGLCQTIQYKNFKFDLGGHRFFSQNNELVDKIRELMGADFVIRPRKSVIRLQGKYFQYPLDLVDLLKNLRLTTSFSFLRGYLVQAIRNGLKIPEEDNYENWLIRQFGRPLYQLYFKPYSEKLWGTQINQLSADWASQRISQLSFWDVLISLVSGKKNAARTFTEKFYYPAGGIGQISETMVAEIESGTGQVELNARITEIKPGRTPLEVTYVQNGKLQQIKAEYVISTIPLPEFSMMVRPQIAVPLQEIAQKLRFRSLIFLNILVDKPRISENTWIYIPEKKYRIMRLQEPRNWYPGNAPANQTSIICEIACNFNDEVWRRDKISLYNQCVAELEELGFPDIRRHTIDYFISRAQHAYPVYYLGYQADSQTLINYLEKYSTLILCGRQGLYRYNNMDHSIEMGLNAAKVILSNKKKSKIYKIATKPDYLEKNHVIREFDTSD